MIFGERETFDGLIAYTLDMENSFDIPRATTRTWGAAEMAYDFSIKRLPFPDLIAEWVEYCKNTDWVSPDPMVRASRASDKSLMDFMEKDMQAKVGGNIDAAFALLCGSAIWRRPEIVRSYLDTLDTRPWWAVRLY